jgi:HPt (histidine-containing phosphotransfer) domain-containing protein
MAEEKVYINAGEGLQRVMNNGKLYARLLEKFKADGSLASLEAQVASGDLDKAQAAAHALKGLAANLSLTELFERTRDLEAQIKEGAIQEGALETVKTVYVETLAKADEVIAKYAT